MRDWSSRLLGFASNAKIGARVWLIPKRERSGLRVGVAGFGRLAQQCRPFG
jgi:hypothetical protein